MQTLSGRQLGGFSIGERLALGGMAAIYRATQISTEREVAVKVLPLHLAGDPKLAVRFEREARMLASLQHPHILPLIDFGREGEWLYLVTPLIPHGDLADRLARWGEPLPLDEVRTIMRQLTDALDAAHRAGIVHRDLKPANVLMDARGNCLLSDFGIAKLEGAMGLTSAGVAIGTPEYMAPEQGAGKPVDARCDIYALGVILYELCTHRVPFEAESPTALLLKHLTEPPPPPRSFNATLPVELERVILKALAKEPAYRYPSAEAMGKAIAAAIPRTSKGTTTTRETVVMRPPAQVAPTLVQPAPEMPRATPRGGAAAWLAATGVGVLLAAGFWWYLQRTHIPAAPLAESPAPRPGAAAAVEPAPAAAQSPALTEADGANAPGKTPEPSAPPVAGSASAPIAASAPAPCGKSGARRFDDFDNRAFEGRFDPDRWGIFGDAQRTKARQGGGVLTLETKARTGELDFVYAQRASGTARPGHVQACVRFAASSKAKHSTMNLYVNALKPDLTAIWWASCYVYADADGKVAVPGCTDSVNFDRNKAWPAPAGELPAWHLVRVEFPSRDKVALSIDGALVASLDVPAAALASTRWSVTLSGWSADGRPVTGEFDDVEID